MRSKRRLWVRWGIPVVFLAASLVSALGLAGQAHNEWIVSLSGVVVPREGAPPVDNAYQFDVLTRGFVTETSLHPGEFGALQEAN